jgi:uncharacterized protein
LAPILKQVAAQSAGSKGLSKEQERAVNDAMAKLIPITREELSWAKMRPAMVEIYKESLTQEDVDGLATFYETLVAKSRHDARCDDTQAAANSGQLQRPL